MNKLRYLLLSLMIISNSAKTSNFTTDKNYIIPLMVLGMAAAIYYYWPGDQEKIIDEHLLDAPTNNSENHKLEKIANNRKSSPEFKKDAVVVSEKHEDPVKRALIEIKDNRFDVKKYFSVIYELILAQKASESKRIKVLNILYNEQNLKDALNQAYENYDYLLLFYAHAPHSRLESPYYPSEPRAHTSLLLGELDENGKVKRVLNIDGYKSLTYVNSRSNQLINKRLVIKDGRPLQGASWENMNCVLYAFTFAEIILNLIEIPTDISNEPNPHALTSNLSTFKKNLFSGIVGIYVPYEENLTPEKKHKLKIDMALDHHNKLREKIAQAYLQSLDKSKRALNFF